jgi:hypothetical protein
LIVGLLLLVCGILKKKGDEEKKNAINRSYLSVWFSWKVFLEETRVVCWKFQGKVDFELQQNRIFTSPYEG